MIWRKDTPTESPIVAYLEGSTIPEVLLLAHEPYQHYYDSAGEEVPTGMIQKWASLIETSTPFNLDEAAGKYANKEFPDESSFGQWGTGDYEPPVDMEYPREIAKDSFKAGAEWMAEQ